MIDTRINYSYIGCIWHLLTVATDIALFVVGDQAQCRVSQHMGEAVALHMLAFLISYGRVPTPMKLALRYTQLQWLITAG